MTKLDDAVNAAGAYLKAAESVVQAYRVLTPEHRAQLQTNFPTLTTALQMASNAYKVFDAQATNLTTPPTP